MSHDQAAAQPDDRIIALEQELERAREHACQAEAAWRKSEANSTTFFALSPIPMAITTIHEGRYLEINTAFERIIGFSRDEVLGHTAAAFGILLDPEARTRAAHMVLAGMPLSDFEMRFRRHDGQERVGLFAAQTIDWEGERALLTAVVDITERKSAEEALHRANAQMEAQIQERTRTLAEANQSLHASEEALRESEERFYNAFMYAAIGMALVALDGHWVKVNQSLCAIVGYTEEELLAKTFQDITHPDDLDIDLAYVHQLLSGEIISYQMEKRYYHKQGHEVWVLLSVSLVKNREGAPQYFISQLEDISARKQAEEALRAQSALFQLFVSRVPAAVAMFDSQMRYIAVSQRWLCDYHVENQHLIGMSHYEVFPEIGERWKILHQRALAGETLSCDEDPFPRADGTMDWVRWEIVPWHRADGSVGGIVMFTEVITERKQAEQAIHERETKYRTLFTVEPDALLVVDADTQHIVEANDAAMTLFGYSHDEILTMTVADLSAEPEATRASIATAKQQQTEHVPLRYYHRKDGSTFPVEIAARTFVLHDNIFIFAAFRDITERKQAEERIRQLLRSVEQWAAEMDATITAIADGVIIYGPDAGIVRINHAAQQLLGYTPEIERQPYAERMSALRITTADGMPLPPEHLPPQRALRGETISGMVLAFTRPDGQARWVSVSAAPIPGPDGPQRGAVVTLADITVLHELQQRQEDLLHIVSHDLRTPLAVIHGHMEFLEDALRTHHLDGDLLLSTSTIDRNVHRMNAMIQDLVDMARLEGQQFPLTLDTVALQTYLPDLLARLQDILPVHRVIIDLPGDLPPVSADYSRLERILLNLLTNAFKYSPPETPVDLRAFRSHEEVVITVSDRGSGIAAKDLPHIFERFYRAGDSRKAEGIGLGLYITRLLVEAHGGHLWVESTVGEGTTFYFTLPIAQAPARKETDA